jgi:hypothetical protein
MRLFGENGVHCFNATLFMALLINPFWHCPPSLKPTVMIPWVVSRESTKRCDNTNAGRWSGITSSEIVFSQRADHPTSSQDQ